MARCMSWLISFARATHSCQERESSENNKVKNYCPLLDSNQGTSAYEAKALSLSYEGWREDQSSPCFKCVMFRNLPAANGTCSKIICHELHFVNSLQSANFLIIGQRKNDANIIRQRNTRQIILLHAHLTCAAGKFPKIAQLPGELLSTRQTLALVAQC